MNEHWKCPTDHPMGYYPEHWMKHCPLCGVAAPRPSEPKTLEEKFLDRFASRNVSYTNLGFGENEKRLQAELAEVAKQHFLSQFEGKEVEEDVRQVLDNFNGRWDSSLSDFDYFKSLSKAALQFLKSRIGEGK